MLLLYNIGIKLYYLIIWLVSPFNKKAKLWITGRKSRVFIRCKGSIWFHFASLGEFEQGRPVLEEMRNLYPDGKIVITFFSPSGYEVRKHTALADAVYYLPLDTARNAQNFIAAIDPAIAIFTKYEYWYHFYKELNAKKIPLFVISAIFRPGQIFFKWYGGLNRRILSFVSRFFVQDEPSKLLLQNIGLTNVTVSGDTRFDRVYANAKDPKQVAWISEFKAGQSLFVAGSTWPADEKLLAALIKQHPDWKFIIAPHEVGEEKIQKLLQLLPKDSTIRYSALKQHTIHQLPFATLIVDNIGMLSSLYQYADIAYIGGGFGAGIHNTLEAAAFGLPVIFGPEYAKFREARELIARGGGFSICSETELEAIFSRLITDHRFFMEVGESAGRYVAEHTGATQAIVDAISVF